MSIAVSFLLSVGVLWALYNMLCVCVTERFSIVHRAYLWTGKRDINVMAPHYLCHFARYALFFISIHSQLLFVNLPWMTIMSTIQISHATFVFLYFFLCTIVINGRFFISLSFLFSPELLLFIVTTLFSFASLRLPLSRLRVAIVMLSYLELVIICSFYSFVCLFIRLKCHSQNVNAQREKERKIAREKKNRTEFKQKTSIAIYRHVTRFILIILTSNSTFW